MARNVAKWRIVIDCSLDGASKPQVDAYSVQGAVSDPLGANKFETEDHVILSKMTWDGTKTGTQIIATGLTQVKSDSGISLSP
jgi:hypothetical protein